MLDVYQHYLSPLGAASPGALGELPLLLQWLVALWLMFLGGCFGSLMNVIVYRWPAGMSILFPNSRCPRCEHPIRLYDNIPVISWIVLSGRCRDCGSRIPVRYPGVEALVALVFGAIALIEIYSGGANLPQLRGNGTIDMATVWQTAAYHAFLFCALICIALIQYDGQRVPWKLFAVSLVVGFVVPIFWPDVRPVMASVNVDDTWRAGLVDGLAGMCLAGAFGFLASVGLMDGPHRQRRGLVVACVLCGVFLGWQAAAIVIVATAGIYFLADLENAARWRGPVATLPWTAILVIVVALLVIYWRVLGAWLPWLTVETGVTKIVATGGLLFVLAWVTKEV